jgi:hypothetical protein
MEFLRQFSDNQLALMGCVGALAAAVALLSISYYGNPANRQSMAPLRGDAKGPAQDAQRKAA